MSRPPKNSQNRVRLDVLMVERGLASSREQAKMLISGDAVEVDGEPVTAPSALVPSGASIALREGARYVSRGGLKLEGALRDLKLDPTGWVAADFGASTGGFTDCLLQHGAARVHALDVGYGQIAWKMRQHPRITVYERINVRHPVSLPEPVDMVVIDVSFISLTLVLPSAVAVLKPGGRILALVKPQFEAGKSEVGRGGVVRDPLIRAACVAKVALWAIERGLRVRDAVASELPGPKGNREIFLLLQKEVSPPAD